MDKVVRGLKSSTKSLNQCCRLEEKVAIVTASSQGIGFAVAQRLAQEGAKVIICSRKEANVNSAVDKLKTKGYEVSGITCHVGVDEDRKKLLNEAISKYGGLDILVLNAAVNPSIGPVLECSEAVWDKIFEINVKSTFLMMKESLPLLKKSKSPSIIIMSSIAGYQPFDMLGVYSISKTTLLSLCKITAQELARDGIRVNCIAPGVIKTKFSNFLHNSEAASEMIIATIPMQRFGIPEEIGSVAAFLASSDASYITGETIVAGGGIKSRL
ncbi:PREDICTED: dehydrogenase/reductase SDR family member 4 [Ceratosolen solmsi marchali]|uniref:Dehydrogenase/reductase SDR family member 4 n=1 Tax=Ceratosolen solmsi marchali TaxID=326594 RepID=A0AAJ6YCR8_9HYME|nr:PREDICTED: dehydrogenase/reductase SDR family member 4 [Ceratosolen solmsi marchali]